MSSIILMTLEKSTLRPMSASSRKRTSTWLSNTRLRPALRMSMRAFCLLCSAPVRVCSRLALESVFLNRSRASSSFRILMVSWIATNSSLRVLTRSSNSAALPSQSFSSSPRNFLSSMRDASVSVRSSFMCTISILSSPTRAVFFSMEAPSESISLLFAARRSLKSVTASASSSSTLARLLSNVSFISFRMPTISPPFGT
mmetsp:Transcript_34164/g.87583  ORF Transcript_34164/g.87583 Transcript_34164/m.87583 type:complete len:200 (-) Transcript_34164:199-798(-)